MGEFDKGELRLKLEFEISFSHILKKNVFFSLSITVILLGVCFVRTEMNNLTFIWKLKIERLQ